MKRHTECSSVGWLGAAFLFASLLSAPLLADSWGPHTPTFLSANGMFRLTVSAPFNGFLRLFRDEGNSATLLWRASFPDENAPLEAYITNDGKHVVLRDRYHEVGEGRVLIFIGESGTALRTYELADFLSTSEILSYTQSISSLWWSKHTLFFFDTSERHFCVVTELGTVRVFALATGMRLDDQHPVCVAARDEARLRARRLLAHPDASERQTGVLLLGALHDTESLPSIVKLLDDPTVTHSAYMGGAHGEMRGVQLAAGQAAFMLDPVFAFRAIRSRLATANTLMQGAWVGILVRQPVTADRTAVDTSVVALLLPLFDSEASTPSSPLQTAALVYLATNGSADLVRRNPPWLKHADSNVRLAAVRTLASAPRDLDVPSFRSALSDADTSVALWAWRALLRLHVPDEGLLLTQGSQSKDPYMQREALVRLVLRGDAVAVAAVLKRVENMSNPWQPFTFEEQYCEALAKAKPKGTLEALRKARTTAEHDGKIAVIGALALFKEPGTQDELMAMAKKGSAFERALAIKWLGYVGDRRSEPLLRTLEADSERYVREAASKALGTLGLPESERLLVE